MGLLANPSYVVKMTDKMPAAGAWNATLGKSMRGLDLNKDAAGLSTAIQSERSPF